MDSSTHGERTRAAILAAGLDIMRERPGGVTARAIGARLGMTHSAVLYHYRTSEALRDAIAAHAVANKDGPIIAYLITTRHPSIDGMRDDERERWLTRVAYS